MIKWKVLGVFTVFSILGSGLALLQGSGIETIPPMTQVAGVDVSGFTREQAARKLDTELASRLKAPVIFRMGTRQWRASRSELGISLDVQRMINVAMAGDPQSETLQWKPLILTVNPVVLRQYLTKNVAPEARQGGKDARLVVNRGVFTVIPGEPGIGLDVDATAMMVVTQPTAQEFEVATGPVQPSVTEQDLAPINTLVARFETRFNRGVRSRVHNLQLASQMIDGTFLRPGEVFSFNRIVGKRSAARGFKLAHVFVEGQVIDGIGGGMCQISTTLYNAVLLADLQVIERHPHMFIVDYVPPGRDAAVAWGLKDFQFRNNTGNPIYISVRLEGSTLKTDLYGTALPNRDINITSYRKYGRNRITLTQVYRIIMENGKEITRELISKNAYKPQPKAVKPQPSGGGTAEKPVIPTRAARRVTIERN